MTFKTALPGTDLNFYSLASLQAQGIGDVSRHPVTMKILIENLLRNADAKFVSEDDIAALANWNGSAPTQDKERAFVPSRVLLQDFTGVPAVVDLAAMRDAMKRRGGDPAKVDPLVPVDLVIDHSVQVDAFGNAGAYGLNIEREYQRNRERYILLRWAQQAFHGFRVVPPGMGIVHQVNLEYLASVVAVRDGVAFPDTVIGTDSHTTMINGIGVLAWGVGGIEAEAAMLGQPQFLLTPTVVGVRVIGEMKTGVTATDLVLTLTEMLRAHGVVNKFVEFFGSGLSSMTAPDRATLSNMCPEYGATSSLFPVDEQTLVYLRQTGRSPERISLIERYCKEQGIFRTDQSVDPMFSEVVELDLSTVESSVAGPRRPQDRVALPNVWKSFMDVYGEGKQTHAGNGDVSRLVAEGGSQAEAATIATVDIPVSSTTKLHDGSVVIAAITSCTNTSNPPVMLGAGLVAKKAVERGLTVPDYVKTSLAPGSRVVTDYLEQSGLMPYLEKLGFNLVGYGCTTCIGNSGPLPEEVAHEIEDKNLACVAVLSGNRNFEGRIHPQVKASYLASPLLVVAYALAGTVNIDLSKDSLGKDKSGNDVFLCDLWPSKEEVNEALLSVQGAMFDKEYSTIFEGDENWKNLPSLTGEMFSWDPDSTYVREAPFVPATPPVQKEIQGARVLALLGDSITTDHISPAGSIAFNSPAGIYLREHGVDATDFNTYGARRGNHEVMMRGTFANIRLRNQLAQGKEGGFTEYVPTGEITTIYEASLKYQSEGTPLIVIAGKEYGSGSSRDWAAKGPLLLGVKAVIAESFERIHRSNLVGMGILPLQFVDGQSAVSLGLTGREEYSISGSDHAGVHQILEVTAKGDGGEIKFKLMSRLDSETDLEYISCGGILPMVLGTL